MGNFQFGDFRDICSEPSDTQYFYQFLELLRVKLTEDTKMVCYIIRV